MPTLQQFAQSVFDVTLHYAGLNEPVMLSVYPFSNLEAQVAELDSIQNDDEGQKKLYGIICSRFQSWRNVRQEFPPSVDSLDSVPTFAQHLYKPNGDGRLFINGDHDAKPAELDIPLNPDALLAVKFPFPLAFDMVKRAMQEVDTQKKRGATR